MHYRKVVIYRGEKKLLVFTQDPLILYYSMEKYILYIITRYTRINLLFIM